MAFSVRTGPAFTSGAGPTRSSTAARRCPVPRWTAHRAPSGLWVGSGTAGTSPRWRGRVMHLAFAYPSRSAVPEYRAYTERVRRLAREITEEFGTADWNPLILEVKDDYPRSLAACALADVLVVNPIRDGMNLVAQ